MEIEDYRILKSDSKREMERMVMEAIQAGYIPQGGISLARTVDKEYDYEKVFAQAMIKYKAVDNNVNCRIS